MTPLSEIAGMILTGGFIVGFTWGLIDILIKLHRTGN